MHNNTGIVISRIFKAPRGKVWQAWTNPEMVKKWWGPKGFWAPSVKIDFKVGGKYIYAMHGPSGSEFDLDMYSSGVYKEIVPLKKLVVTDYFSDKKGNLVDLVIMGMDADMPAEMEVIVTFADERGNKTKLTITYPKPKSEIQFEAMKKSGMEDGWNSSLDKMAKLVE